MVEYLEDRYDWTRRELVAVYDELPLWSAMFGRLLFQFLPLYPGLKVLDVGCGTGFPILELAQRLGPSCRVYGVDPWSVALERLRQKIETLKIKNVEIQESDAASMPFESETFDLIVSNLGVNNFEDPSAAVAECCPYPFTKRRIYVHQTAVVHKPHNYGVVRK